MITVVTPAKTQELVLLETIRDRLGVTSSPEGDDLLRHLIAAARRDIEDFTGRVFAKQIYRETVRGYGDTELMLSRFPIRAIASVSHKGAPITGFTLDGGESGLVFREDGWWWTARVQQTLTRWPIPNSESPDFTFVYTAGWSLPGDDYAADTISFDDSDNSINDTENAFPILAIGDKIIVGGSTSNDGEKTVVSWAPGKIVVTEALTTEAAGSEITMTVRDLPENVEEAAILAVSESYRLRTSATGGDVQSKRVGDLSITYAQPQSGLSTINALPLRAEQRLQRYVVTV